MKVRRSRNRGGIRGRKRGTKIRYNAYQTSRYQSIWLRTERARRLAPPTQLDVGVWQFRSKRKRVKPYRTTTREGSLAPITTFTGTPTRSGNPPDCPLPETFYDYLNPIFRWAANGIHDCSKDNPGSAATTSDGSPTAPDAWFPAPPGETRTAIVTFTGSSNGISYAPSCGTLTSNDGPNISSFSVTFGPTDSIQFLAGSSSGASFEASCNGFGATYTGTYVDTSLVMFLPGFPTLLFSSHRFTAGDVYNTGITRVSVSFQFTSPPAPPPAGYVPQSDLVFELPALDDNGNPITLQSLATAGIEAQSNVFQVPERLDIFTSIAYSIAPKMPAPSGSIALKLFTDGTQTVALSEVPTNSIGSLNVPMTLLPAHDYQFKISIPESTYCDAAIVRLGGKFICNCPDFNRKSKAFPSRYPSELGDRDWSASSAGTRRDCKHIIYLKLQTAEPIDAEPDDLKDIRQWHKDQEARRKAIRKRERHEAAQSRRDALKRAKADLRAINKREKGITDAARSEVHAARNYLNRKPRKKSTKPKKYRGPVYQGGG